MEEIEVPVESAQETLMEKAEEAREKWIGRAALTSALLAVCAAISALLAGHHSNEAMIEQIQASDTWGYYQAKSIKSSVLVGRMEVLKALGKESTPDDEAKLEKYKKEQEELTEKAKEKETSSGKHLGVHQIFARAVTMFQVAIAIAAVSVLTRRRRFWLVSLLFGAAGLLFSAQAFWSSLGL